MRSEINSKDFKMTYAWRSKRKKMASRRASYKNKRKITKTTPVRNVKNDERVYTKSGRQIFSPDRYAATGAPMYKTPKCYVHKKNINVPTAIYEVDCEDGVTYVGKTVNVERRMRQHFTGNGSKVTKKFQPLNCRVVKYVPGFLSSQEEQDHTEKLVKKKGYEKVRGGKWVNSTTLPPNRRAELRRLRVKHFLGE